MFWASISGAALDLTQRSREVAVASRFCKNQVVAVSPLCPRSLQLVLLPDRPKRNKTLLAYENARFHFVWFLKSVQLLVCEPRVHLDDAYIVSKMPLFVVAAFLHTIDACHKTTP